MSITIKIGKVMNSHLNIFKTYTATNREHQLENDLTRALAICFQEDPLFFHKILEDMFSDTPYYEKLFGSINADTSIAIDIQKRVDKINGYEHIFAVSLSDSEIGDFWAQNHNREYDPICDIVIAINGILVVIEAKRNNENCTAQLYNQIKNIVKYNKEYEGKGFTKANFNNLVTPYDLNWTKLMAVATKVLSFEMAANNQNRFLSDFVKLVRSHNYRWMPEPAISSLQPDDSKSIVRRIESTLDEATKQKEGISKLDYNDRQGLVFTKNWAQEILFSITKKGDLKLSIYPGNTKGQGYALFKNDPEFSSHLNIKGVEYPINEKFHIKLTSFQRYFAGISFEEKDIKQVLYSKQNFSRFTGRKKRGEQWNSLEQLFDASFKEAFDWRAKCTWENIIASGRNQFDISFGYQMDIYIPFKRLQELDQNHDNLDNLVDLTKNIYSAFYQNLLLDNQTCDANSQ